MTGFFGNVKKTQKSDNVKNIVMVDIEKIQPDSKQIRKTFEQSKLEELASSIKEHGVISPIIVRENGDGYHIIAGERRYRASKIAEQKQIPCIIEDFDNQKAKSIQIIENLQRADITAIETAMAFSELLNNGMKQKDIVKNTGLSKGQVSKYCTVAKLPDLEKIHKENPNVSLNDLYAITQKIGDEQEEAIEEVASSENDTEKEEPTDIEKLWALMKKDINKDVNNLKEYLTIKKIQKLIEEKIKVS